VTLADARDFGVGGQGNGGAFDPPLGDIGKGEDGDAKPLGNGVEAVPLRESGDEIASGAADGAGVDDAAVLALPVAAGAGGVLSTAGGAAFGADCAAMMASISTRCTL
jgi:hypothetical protein